MTLMNAMPPHQTIFTPAPPKITQARASKIDARDVNVYYGEKHAIKHLSISIPDKAVSAFIGPSGCGKSTFLRSINRMNDTIPGCRVTGSIVVDEGNIYDSGVDVVDLRARIGMVWLSPTSRVWRATGHAFPAAIRRGIDLERRLLVE